MLYTCSIKLFSAERMASGEIACSDQVYPVHVHQQVLVIVMSLVDLPLEDSAKVQEIQITSARRPYVVGDMNENSQSAWVIWAT